MIRLGTYHGLDFSPDSRFLVATEIQGKGSIEVINSKTFDRVCLLNHAHQNLKPKGISFAKDGLFIAIVYAANIQSSKQTGSFPLVIDMHEFDSAKGVIKSDPVACTVIEGEYGASYENCSFLPNCGTEYSLLVASQADDQILNYIFCSTSQKMTYAGICTSQMSFPHGIDISEDGRYVAVTNYGDDTLRVLDISGS
jgi:DNA-binding beta-propeller fold protein YncE